jgi:hypothetical protein
MTRCHIALSLVLAVSLPDTAAAQTSSDADKRVRTNTSGELADFSRNFQSD